MNNLSNNLRELLKEHGEEAVKAELKMLTSKSRGRPKSRIEMDTQVIHLACGHIAEGSATKALKRAFQKVTGEKLTPKHERRLYKRIQEHKLPDDPDLWTLLDDAVAEFSQHVDIVARTREYRRVLKP